MEKKLNVKFYKSSEKVISNYWKFYTFPIYLKKKKSWVWNFEPQTQTKHSQYFSKPYQINLNKINVINIFYLNIFDKIKQKELLKMLINQIF